MKFKVGQVWEDGYGNHSRITDIGLNSTYSMYAVDLRSGDRRTFISDGCFNEHNPASDHNLIKLIEEPEPEPREDKSMVFKVGDIWEDGKHNHWKIEEIRTSVGLDCPIRARRVDTGESEDFTAKGRFYSNHSGSVHDLKKLVESTPPEKDESMVFKVGDVWEDDQQVWWTVTDIHPTDLYPIKAETIHGNKARSYTLKGIHNIDNPLPEYNLIKKINSKGDAKKMETKELIKTGKKKALELGEQLRPYKKPLILLAIAIVLDHFVFAGRGREKIQSVVKRFFDGAVKVVEGCIDKIFGSEESNEGK